MTARVRIVRIEARWRDTARAYRVLIDGSEVGLIGDGESAQFEVEPGRHSVRLQVDWSGSREVAFQVGSDQEVAFRCRPRSGPAIWLLLQSIFVRDRWVILEPI